LSGHDNFKELLGNAQSKNYPPSPSMKTIATFYDKFKLYLLNTSWIMGEKILAMGLGFLVSVLVARYLGPEGYGVLAYAISLTAIFATAGHLGLGGLVVREIVTKPTERAETLGTTLILKFTGVAVGYLVLLAYALIYEKSGSLEFWVLIIVASSLLFQPFRVIDFWFEAHVHAKYPAIAQSSSLLIAVTIKIFLVFSGAGLIFFAFVHFLQAVMIACFLLFLFKAKSHIPISSWQISSKKAKELLSQGWVIFLGAIFATIYLKIDQVMLKWFVGSEAVGIYAVAAILSEAWYFVPTAIVASLFPRLIELKVESQEKFNRRLQQIFDLLFVVALMVAVVVTVIAGPVIQLFFGAQYLAASSILAIHVWAALFIFMRAALSKWILIENVLVFSLITQSLGALANVCLNLVLIPHYGGKGAAIATLISYAMASYFSLAFYSRSRPIFWMMSKAILAPIRYPMQHIGGKVAN